MQAFKKLLRPEVNILFFLVLSLVAGALLSPYFLDLPFLLGSTSLYAELGLIATCFTLLMTLGEIDLSVAANMTLVACTVGTLYSRGAPMAMLIPVGLAAGLLLGMANGLLVVLTGLPSLIITIGTLSIYKGLAQVLVGDHAVGGFPQWFLGIDKVVLFGVIPAPLLLVAALTVILELLLRRNFFGRRVVAVGLSPEAALYAGVRVQRLKVLLFSLQGLFCGAAGLLSISRLEVAKYSIGVGGEMDVVTMVLLGGTAFTGGKGSVTGTLAAFFILVLIRTGMRLAAISNYVQIAVLGALLIVVVITSQEMGKLSEKLS